MVSVSGEVLLNDSPNSETTAFSVAIFVLAPQFTVIVVVYVPGEVASKWKGSCTPADSSLIISC
ncbi:hypothetical protein SDC9_204588 [bioreactor metagenome]|uniref:Uncharacterized protein n=1 Tax=bioreactor metagenome TaxID=1076179 RepID=A0A645IZM2_9ZZZZ